MRAQTYSALTSVNPLVPKGMTIVESDTGRAKTGDGYTLYNDLAYLGEGGGGEVGGVSQGQFDALAAQVASINSAVSAKQDASSAATDPELAAATSNLNASMATLTSAVAAKQDSSSAATDAEVASAIAGVNTSISNLTSVVASKQDASASSTALAQAVATLNAAIALKADLSTVSTDAERDTAVATRALRDARYVDGGSYLAGQMVVQGGQVYAANADFTAAGAFNPAEPWVLLNSNEVARATLSVVTAATTTDTAIAGWQIVVPANSGPVSLRLSNVLLALVTGTSAANTAIASEIRIKDEAGTMLAFMKEQRLATGTTQTHVYTQGTEVDVSNSATAKTYSVWLRGANVGVAGATATIHTSASGFVDPVLKAVKR